MTKVSNISRAMKILRKIGDICEKVEHWNHFARRRQDLFGVFDIISVCPLGAIKFIQVFGTERGEYSAHWQKMIDTQPELIHRLLGNSKLSIELWGWHGVKKTVSKKAFFLVHIIQGIDKVQRVRIFTDGTYEELPDGGGAQD